MATSPAARAVLFPAAIIGWALSGFFDGILLHQVLEWHHLLSLVPGQSVQTLRTQLLADGLFHVLMYGFAAWGIALMVRRRQALAAPGGERVLAGGMALGFGVWNVVDVAGFHWVLGIHRIRVNVPDPMLYDLGWLGLFALPPLFLAWRLLGRPAAPGSERPTAALAAVIALAAGAGALAARPVPGIDAALVMFAPGMTDGAALDAIAAAGARPLWVDPALNMWGVALGGGEAEAAMQARGAWLVTQSPAVAGCLAAARG